MTYKTILLTVSLLGAAYGLSGQPDDMELVAEICSETCPSSNAKDIFEQFKPYLYQAFRDSESGTVNSHEEGGYIIQTKKKQENGCYLYCTRLYRGEPSKNCFFEGELCFVQHTKPEEDDFSRVVAHYHTHPVGYSDEIAPFLEINDLIDPASGRIQFNGYEFSGIDYDQEQFSYLNMPSEGDKIATVAEGIPEIIISGDGTNKNRMNAVIVGHTDYKRDENGLITGVTGEVVFEPHELAWECSACIEIVDVDTCIEAEGNVLMHASVTGIDDNRVSWGAVHGSIDDDGLYTAPPEPVTDQIYATSVADPEASDTINLEVGNCSSYWKLTLSGDYFFSDSSDQISHVPAGPGMFQIDFSHAENADIKGILKNGMPVETGFSGSTAGLFFFSNCGAVPGDMNPCGFTVTLGNSAMLVSAELNIELYSEELIRGKSTSTSQDVVPNTYPPVTRNYKATLEFVSRNRL